MKYELAILTHGRSAPLPSVLASFREYVRPEPARIRVFGDALDDLSALVGTVRGAFPYLEDPDVSSTHPSRQAGFCGATGRLWGLAAQDDDVDFVFWLEHDFVFERPVLLEQLSSLLDQDDRLAQVALVRNAVSDQEVAAGGLIESRPATFSPCRGTVEAEGIGWTVEWLEHRAYFTTNPSLMRRIFMAENPWLDDGQPYCEGRFGLDLIGRGYRFAYWGDGVPYVRHVGHRDGVGY